jgi:hypothetical protein
MQAVLGVLVLVAATLAAVAIGMGAGPFVGAAWPVPGLGRGLRFDAVSLALGFVAGIAAVWLARIPWAALPRAVLATILGWRRNAFFMGLAVLSAGVLLFY